MATKVDLAFEMRGRGESAPRIAAALGVHVRTVRKWWSRGPADEPAEGEGTTLPATTPAELRARLFEAAARETAELLRRQPGSSSLALARLVRTLDAMGAAAEPEPAFDHAAFRAELARRLDALRWQQIEGRTDDEVRADYAAMAEDVIARRAAGWPLVGDEEPPSPSRSPG